MTLLLKFPTKYLFFSSLLLIFSSCQTDQKSKSVTFNSGEVEPSHIIYRASEERRQCDLFKTSLPKRLQTQIIDAPSDWDAEKNDSKKVKIFLYGRWGKKNKPTLIISNGGPGSSSHRTFKVLADIIKKRFDGNFVFYDQRGTGCSTAYPKLSRKTVNQFQSFTARQIAHDLKLISNQFEGEKILFGHSFGSMITLWYAHLFPSATDKIVNYGSTFFTESAMIVDAITEMQRERYKFFLGWIKADSDFKKVLTQLKTKLPDSLCFQDEEGFAKICGYNIVRTLGHYLTAKNKDRFKAELRELLSPSGDLLFDKLKAFVNQRAWPIIDPTMLLVWSYEGLGFHNGKRTCAVASEILESEIPINPLFLDSCKAQLDSIKKALLEVKVNKISEADVVASLRKNSDLKIYELLGDKDLTAGSFNPKFRHSRWSTTIIEGIDHHSGFDRDELWRRINSR